MSKSESTVYKNESLVLLGLSRGAESRKKILKALLFNPKNCSQIAREVKLDWWTVQKHLRVLMKDNIVVSLDFGRIKFYKLTIKGEELISSVQEKAKKSHPLK